jgi:hypothetical protein
MYVIYVYFYIYKRLCKAAAKSPNGVLLLKVDSADVYQICMDTRQKSSGFVPRTTFEIQAEADHKDGVFEELRARTAQGAESPNCVLRP